MKWGLRSSRHNQREKQQSTREEEHEHEHEQQEEGKGKGKSKGKSRAAFLSFSPLAWLSKLTTKNNAAAGKPKPASSDDKSAAATGGFPSCFHKGASTSTSTSMSSSAASQSSLMDSSPAEAPRRLPVGNDDTAEAAAARQLYIRLRHYSVGGDRDLQTLRNLIPFSRTASPLPMPAPFVPVLKTMPPLPSDTDEEKRPRSRRRRRRSGGRRSFSGRTPGARVAAAVRVRSPRRVAAAVAVAAAAAVSELERFAVVRRTSDPQREFRASMVEMIASKRIGRPEELETLLACYLSLNADEHHDCIVKVFRQVWFELNPARVAAAAAAPRS